MITVYHITPAINLKSIIQHGLIPQIGSNAQAIGETKPAIYLFPTIEDSDTALGSWLDDLYDDNEDLIRLSITCPNELIHRSTVEYELVSYHHIQAKYITKIEHV